MPASTSRTVEWGSSRLRDPPARALTIAPFPSVQGSTFVGDPDTWWWRTPHGHWLEVDPTGTHHHGRDPDRDTRLNA